MNHGLHEYPRVFFIRLDPFHPRPKGFAMMIKWDEYGLAPAVVQDAQSGAVLMLAYMNEEALRLTLETGEAHFWSRSRQEMWHKGATSGNVQRVCEVLIDCDADTILLKVVPAGPACHTGEYSCFYRSITSNE